MTDFTKLPLRLRSAQVCAILDVNIKTLRKIEGAGTLKDIRVKGEGIPRYLTADVLKLVRRTP